ncbi:MAG TPA: HU family DNA-binding protein [Elusimicrobiota bacterium]|nr:HU family DNA-binding protein [Elusimicrobiota bacterium]
MNRLDVIKDVSKILGTKTEAAQAVEATFEAIRSALNRGEKVVISNFGTFRVKERRERQGRNPRTGKSVSVPSRRGVRFKASRNLLEPGS